MKRATVLLFAAVMALVLVYPASTLFAAPPALQDIPTPQIITPQVGADQPAFTGDEESGDADDIAGYKERKDKPTGTSGGFGGGIQIRLAYEFWRIYFFGVTLFR
jgi:hypothetical protein